jgi:hypothetical protein
MESVGAFQHMQKRNPGVVGLKIIDSFLVDYNVKYATLNGFETCKQINVTEEYSFDTVLSYFKTDRCCPVIINGHVVSSGLNEYRYDYTTFNWDHYQPTLKQRLLDNNTLIF